MSDEAATAVIEARILETRQARFRNSAGKPRILLPCLFALALQSFLPTGGAQERIKVFIARDPPLFPKGAKVTVQVSLENSPREVMTEALCSVLTLQKSIVQETSVPLRGKAGEKVKAEFTVEGLNEGIHRIVCVLPSGLTSSCWAGILSGNERTGPVLFDELPASLRERLGIGRPRNSLEIDSPFGIYAHNELPMLEAVRTVADYGAGDVRFPQYPQLPLTGLLFQNGIEPVFHLCGDEKEARSLVRSLKGKVKYYRFGGDEPNNRGTHPRDYIETLKLYSRVIREEDPQAKIMGADLGDEGTADYWKRCVDERILDWVDLNPYGYFLWGNGLGLFLRMEELKAYSERNFKKSYENYLSPLITFGQPPSIGQANRMVRHFIEVYWRGTRMVNLYKLIDHIEPFGLLHYEGTLSAPYAMLQNLCSVLNYSVKPAERPVVEPLSPIAQFNHRAFVSPDRALILFWEMDGERVGLPNYPGKPTDFVVSDAGFAAPCEFDLLTGEVRGIDYSECGSSTVVRGCLVRPYPKALVLLKPSQDFIAAPTAASPSPKWKHLNSSSGLPNDWVTSIAIDGDSDELWVGTYNCGGRQGGNAKYLSRIRRSDYSAEHFGFDDTRIDQTPSRILIAEPFVWAATRAAGLGRYDRAEKQWKLISSVEDEGWGTLDFVDMAQAHGALWVANLCGGLGRLDLSTAHWATFTETRYRELTGGPPVTEPNDLPRANRVVAVIAEGPGVYAATLSNGLSCLDLRTSQWCRVLTPDKLPNGAIWAAKAKEGKIWLAGTGGLCAYDTREQKSKTFLFPATTPMSGQRVVHLEFDGDGGVWAGTYYSGIARLDPEAGKYTLFEPSDDGLPNARLSALLPHHDKVWLGFWGAGVAAFDIAAGRFQRLSTHDGLLDDRVWTIAADPSSVYFGTYRGLSILRTSPLAIARAGQSPMAGKSALFTLSFVNLTGQPLSNIELKVEPGEPGLKVVPGALPAPNSAPPDTEIQAKCEVMIPASFRARQLTLSASLNAIAPDGKRLSFATEQRFLCTPPVHLKSHTPLATITNVESRLLELRIGWGFAEPGKCSVRLAGPETLEISPETRELGFTKDGEEQFCSFNLKLREGERAAREPSEIPIEADTPLGKLTLGSIKVNTDHLDTWMVIGPFSAADSGPGVSVKEKKALPPETEIDFSKTYQGRERGVAWRRWYKSSAVPEYDLDALMGTKKPGDNKESVVFLFTKIGSDAEREVELKVSVPQSQAPGGKTQPAAEVTVWLNKEIVVGRTEGHGTLSEIADVTAKEETPEEPGTESLDLPRLKKGESTILIKCLKHAEPWQLTLTFLDAKAGQPIPGLVFAP